VADSVTSEDLPFPLASKVFRDSYLALPATLRPKRFHHLSHFRALIWAEHLSLSHPIPLFLPG